MSLARVGMHLQWTTDQHHECSSSVQEMQQPTCHVATTLPQITSSSSTCYDSTQRQQPPTCQVATTLPQMTSRPGCSRLMCCGEGELYNDGER